MDGSCRWVGAWIGLLVAFGGSACASPAPEEVKGAETSAGAEVPGIKPTDPFAYLPADAELIAEIDLRAVSGSPYVRYIIERISDLDELEKVVGESEEATGATADATPGGDASPSAKANRFDRWVALLGRLERVVGGAAQGTPSEGAEEGERWRASWLLQGDLADGELEALLREEDDDMQPVTVGGLQGIGDDKGLVLRVDDRTYLLGSRKVVDEALIARGRAGDRPAVMSDPTFRDYAERVGFGKSNGAVVGVLPSGLHDVSQPSKALLRAVALRLELTDGVGVQAFERMETAAAAEESAAKDRAMLSELEGEEVIKLLGLAEPLKRTEVTVDGNEVRVQIAMTDAETRNLLEQLEQLLLAFLRGFVGALGDVIDASVGVEP